MTMTIHVDIVSANAAIFSGQAEMLIAPAICGDIGVLPRHAPLLTPLRAGEVRVKTEAHHEDSFFISGGMLEVQPHVVTVLADTAIRAHDLDEAAALEAKQRVEANLADRKSNIDYAQAQVELAETIAQLQTIQRLKRKLKDNH